MKDPNLVRITQRLEKDPGVGAILLLAENYFRQGDFAAAVEASRRGLQLYPENLEIRLLLGQALFAMHCPAEAEETLLPLVTQIRRLGEVFNTLAQIYHHRGLESMAQEAATLYQLLQGESPSPEEIGAPEPKAPPRATQPEGSRRLAQALQILQNWQQALQARQSKGR